MPSKGNADIGADVPRVSLRVAEAAAALGISEDTFAKIAHEIPCVRIGRVRLYPLPALALWVEQHATRTLDGVR